MCTRYGELQLHYEGPKQRAHVEVFAGARHYDVGLVDHARVDALRVDPHRLLQRRLLLLVLPRRRGLLPRCVLLRVAWARTVLCKPDRSLGTTSH